MNIFIKMVIGMAADCTSDSRQEKAKVSVNFQRTEI